jgi:hypothetical protein
VQAAPLISAGSADVGVTRTFLSLDTVMHMIADRVLEARRDGRGRVGCGPAGRLGPKDTVVPQRERLERGHAVRYQG